MKTKQTLEQGFQSTLSGFNELQNKFLVDVLKEYSKGIQSSITTNAGNITKQSLDVQQGHAFEAHHAGSYNIEAAGKGANNHRATTNTGLHNDTVTDLRLNSPDGSTDYQAKSYKDGKSSAKAFDHDRYQDVGKLVPEDQLPAAQAAAERQAQRNSQTRPDISEKYKKTARTLDDKIYSNDRPEISSIPITRRGKGSAEELVTQTKSDGKGPEYSDKERVRAEFNNMQYANAAKAGALAGASMTAASELIGILQSDRSLTQEQCLLAAERVVVGTLKGSGNAILVTGIQHIGQSLVDTASHTALKTAGHQLTKGNVAAAATNIIVDLSQNIYRFSRGEIDSLEFASSTISTSVSAVGNATAYGIGSTTTASFLGQWVASEISSKVFLGTTLGALGPIAFGAVFSIGFSAALSAYVDHFSSKGKQLAINDIQNAMSQLNNGSINLSQYAGMVGTMSEFKFSWHDMVPLSGGISVLSEYSTRKNQLMNLQKTIALRLANLPDDERQLMYQINARYQQQIQVIEQEYQHMRNEITHQAGERYNALNNALNEHLESNYLMFIPIKKNFEDECATLNNIHYQQQIQQYRIEFYRQELERIQQIALESNFLNDEDAQQVRRTMLATINTRLSDILPEETSWDKAYKFLVSVN